MVTVIASIAALHPPLLVDVSVKVTLPAVLSAAEGVYVAPSVVLLGVNDPVPEVVQVPVVLPPLTEPDKVTIALLAQTV